MTAWHLTVGYQYDGSGDAWEILRDTVEEVRQNPLVVAEKANICHGDARAYLSSHAAITSREGECPGLSSVVLLASGGEPGRLTKERLARAFILLVLERMAEMDININVAAG